MCPNLTSRLTKHVSPIAITLSFVLSSAVFSSATVFAQDEVGMADPSVPRAEVENTSQNEVNAEQILEQDAQARQPAVDQSANKLEEIDEESVTYQDEGKELTEEEQAQTATPLSEEVEDLKKAALELNRDLLILEEELLFPANSQIVIFMSLDVGEYFALDSVKVLIDDKLVASHLYTKRQNTALALGGIQRLYLGNLKSGEHEVTAFFVGMGPDNREYKRGATVVIDKDEDPKLLELKVRDSTANMQPEFEFEEWHL